MKENNSNRTCLVTGEEKNKEELLRFTLTPDRQVIPDFKKKLPGKGFYITNSRAVLAQAVSKNVFKKFGKNTKVDPNLGGAQRGIFDQFVVSNPFAWSKFSSQTNCHSSAGLVLQAAIIRMTAAPHIHFIPFLIKKYYFDSNSFLRFNASMK